MFNNAKSVIINNKEVKTIKNKNGGILYEKEYPLILSVTSDKDILSYYDNDVANLTVNYIKDGTPYNGAILCSTFPDFFDGTNLYIPFEIGDEDWGIMLGGTFDILNEDKTLYRTLTSSQQKYIKCQDGVVTIEEYMQDIYEISLPTKGFFLVTLQQLSNSMNGFTSLGGSSFGINSMSNGVMNVSYNSRGVGDVTFYFTLEDGTILQETYELEDCIFYSNSEFTSSSTNQYLNIASLDNLPNSFELSVDYKTGGEARFGLFSSNNFTGNPNYSVFIGSPDPSSKWYFGYRTTSTYTVDVYGLATDYHNYLIKRDGNSFYFKRDGNDSYSKSVSFFDDYTYILGMMGWYGSSSAFAKNIKLKSL